MKSDVNIANIAQGLIDEFTSLKALQRIGSDGIHTFRPRTGFITIDVDPSNPTIYLKKFRIIFTPTDSSLKSGLAFRMVAVQKRTVNGQVVLINKSDSFDRRPVSGNVQTWEPNSSIMFFSGDGREMKLYCFTTADGIVSIEYI